MDSDSNYRLERHRLIVSRRSILRAAGGLSAAGFLVACQPVEPAKTPPSTTGSGVQPGPTTDGVPQIFKFGNGNPPVTMDPNGTSLTSSYFYAIYDSLTYIDPEAKL